jgi:sec-independent protein translocase protein TatB
MFDIGMSELIILAVIGLIAIGPKQLPQVAATLVRMLNDFKRMTSVFTDEFTKVRDSTRQVMSDTQNEILKSLEEGDKQDPETLIKPASQNPTDEKPDDHN